MQPASLNRATALRSREYGGATAVGEFGNVLDVDGLHAALGWLNQRTRFRFTGAFSDTTGSQRIIELFDRENPGVTYKGETDHSARYPCCGVLLVDAGGVRVGTLSHYDHRPRIASDECRRLLRDVSPLVVEYCQSARLIFSSQACVVRLGEVPSS